MKMVALLLAAAAALGGSTPPEPVDLIIRGGTIYSGSDAPFVGDVAVSGDRIHAVGPNLTFAAARVVSASSEISTPGPMMPPRYSPPADTQS